MYLTRQKNPAQIDQGHYFMCVCVGKGRMPWSVFENNYVNASSQCDRMCKHVYSVRILNYVQNKRWPPCRHNEPDMSTKLNPTELRRDSSSEKGF